MKIFLSILLVVFLSYIRADNESSMNACILPSTPTNGQYKVNRLDNPDPTKAYEFLALNYSCTPGYETLGNTVRLCIKGVWSSDEPKCVRKCKLIKNPTVEYLCGDTLQPCNEWEPEDTLVRTKCRPEYYFPADLRNMRCVNGSWNYLPTCLPVCGVFPPQDLTYKPWFNSNGLGRVPWLATIYKKSSDKPYTLHCGATLVSNNIVLTAAHCLWDLQTKKILPTKEFAVAIGKTFLRWDADEDKNAQKSDVAEIIIHPEFPLASTNDFKSNIAVVKLEKEVTFGPDVRPACLDFDASFEEQQIENFKGLYSGWSGGVLNNQADRTLKVLELPYIPMEQCAAVFREEYRKYVTMDKLCAGGRPKGADSACRAGFITRGNTGGGITYPEEHRGKTMYYLRGVATLTSAYDHCSNDSLAIFTKISKHEHFIKKFL